MHNSTLKKKKKKHVCDFYLPLATQAVNVFMSDESFNKGTV